MRFNGAEIIIKSLERLGIGIVAGIPGGANLPLYNALYKSSIRHVLARHEQGAGFIAHGMARSTGKPAVCFATSGPGATNLLTAIADAKLDSIPLIAITGQVATSLIGTDAFQEIDIYSMTLPITKHNFLVKKADELLMIIPEALRLAVSGRPGPVLIDVPKDIQTEEVVFDCWPETDKRKDDPQPVDISIVMEAAHMINRSKKPVIYAGGGIMSAQAHRLMHTLARKNSIPSALTLMGLGCFPPDDDLYLGMLGMHGAHSTNIILDESDLLLALGVRFDDRAVGKVKEFCPHASIIHIDIDEAEINKIKRADLSINSDLTMIIKKLIPFIEQNNRKAWISHIMQLKDLYPSLQPGTDNLLHPVNIIRTIHNLAPSGTIITTDVGQHQMWVAQAYPFSSPRTLLTSGGLGTMGFGLPAAIGAALAKPGQHVVCISGDGSIQMNLQELATLAELDIPVTVIILNNGHLGLVRQQQELFYDKKYIASRFTCKPDFSAIAREFGIRGYRICESSAIRKGLAEALSYPGPSVMDICIHETENVLPMVPPGAANPCMIGGEIEEYIVDRQRPAC
jgi:acetolactate synthase I/II/III large subunit